MNVGDRGLLCCGCASTSGWIRLADEFMETSTTRDGTSNNNSFLATIQYNHAFLLFLF